jgi:hypothetical protein
LGNFHLVHANITVMRASFDDPIMAGFVAWVDKIDHLASQSPGFVSQATPPDEGSIFHGQILLNISICDSVECLQKYTYQGRHAQALVRRAECFIQYQGPNYVLYWVPFGHTPLEQEIKERLDHLSEHSPSPYAFDFEQQFSPKETAAFTQP